jgi:hypothetical protein
MCHTHRMVRPLRGGALGGPEYTRRGLASSGPHASRTCALNQTARPRLRRLQFASGPQTELVVHARHKGFCKVRLGAGLWPGAAPGGSLLRLRESCPSLDPPSPAPLHRGPLPPPQPPRALAPPLPLPPPLPQIAIEQQASLVPVLALGEALQLRNLAHVPSLQAYTTRRFRFPFPFWLGGRWGVTPLPSRVPLVYVVGRPIAPPPLRAAGGGGGSSGSSSSGSSSSDSGAAGTSGAPDAGHGVPRADVDALHSAYFSALADLFRRYRHLHPHFTAASLVLAYD